MALSVADKSLISLGCGVSRFDLPQRYGPSPLSDEIIDIFVFGSSQLLGLLSGLLKPSSRLMRPENDGGRSMM